MQKLLIQTSPFMDEGDQLDDESWGCAALSIVFPNGDEVRVEENVNSDGALVLCTVMK
jgi:hypothetical protein